MPIDPRLIETMSCPSCRGKLQALGGDDGLRCVECLRSYPIRRGVQVLMMDETDAAQSRRET